MMHLGLTVYFWGAREQNRLLTELLGPAVAAFERDGSVARFWFDRFDTRGPHLFAILTLSDRPADGGAEVRRRLATQLEEYLQRRPSMAELSQEEIETRHRECRGKTQCEADGYPGLAANNSYCLFEHPAGEYPFGLSRGLPDAENRELWRLLDEQTFWAIDRLADCAATAAVGPAVRWAAALDVALRALGADAAAYWRYHATTLLLPLAERLASEELEVLASLPGAVGEKNTQVFSRGGEEVEGGAEVRQPSRRVVELALADTGQPSGRRWRLQREITHVVWKQLGMPVALHVPLVLFAWHRNLAAAAAATSPVRAAAG